jgi:hypothetical protein
VRQTASLTQFRAILSEIMKTLLVSLVVVLGWSALANGQQPIREFPVDRSAVNVDNEFNRRDPFYQQRAGAFYDDKYVAPSAEALIRIAQIRQEQIPGTRDALRAFVYEWLDAYVRGNGGISRIELETCIARMDERFDLLLDSPIQRKLYRVWRHDDSNQLGFLMSMSATTRIATSPPRPPACEGLKIAGLAQLSEHVPYPRIGQSWPGEVSTATIVRDSLVAHPSSDMLPPISVDEVREALMRYLVVARNDWGRTRSIPGGLDEGGWLVAGGQCFAWAMRPGGLAWIGYPDGTAVYLSAPCPGDIKSPCAGADR